MVFGRFSGVTRIRETDPARCFLKGSSWLKREHGGGLGKQSHKRRVLIRIRKRRMAWPAKSPPARRFVTILSQFSDQSQLLKLLENLNLLGRTYLV
jgi:hypothetical protein